MIRKLTNKKADPMVILYIVGGLFLLLFLAVGIVIASSVLNLVMDTAVPEFTGLGMVGDTNMTEISGYTIVPANTFVQNFTWIAGIIYIFGIVAVLGVAYIYKNTGEKIWIAFFISLMLILIIASIFISNIYEAFYDGDDEIGSRLKEHAMLSWLILYSPLTMIMVGFIAGIILFSGAGENY